jgi:hypothetical protein
VLLPAAIFCVDALHPGPTAVESPELWLAQKIVFVVGGLFAVIFALGHTIVDKARPGEKK